MTDEVVATIGGRNGISPDRQYEASVRLERERPGGPWAIAVDVFRRSTGAHVESDLYANDAAGADAATHLLGQYGFRVRVRPGTPDVSGGGAVGSVSLPSVAGWHIGRWRFRPGSDQWTWAWQTQDRQDAAYLLRETTEEQWLAYYGPDDMDNATYEDADPAWSAYRFVLNFGESLAHGRNDTALLPLEDGPMDTPGAEESEE